MVETFYIKRPSAAALNGCIELRSKLHHKHQEEGNVTSHSKDVTHLLQTHTTDYGIAETGGYMTRFKQPSSKSPTKNAEVLWNKAL